MARWRLAAAGAALAALAASPAEAGVKDGVEAWSRGDYARAAAEWRKPAAAGDADAQFNLAQAYKLGKGVPPDLKRAEDLYFKAAQQGHLQAADTYGLLLFQSGRREAAMPWLAASAERGEPRAQYVLGVARYNGDLVPRDPVLAYALMTRAVAAGLEPAKATLTTMDQTLSLEQRQQGVALAAELEREASAQRAAQMASLGLGEKTAPLAPPPWPEPVTAGADYANPVVVSRPVRGVARASIVAVPNVKAAPAPAKVAVVAPAVQPAAARGSGTWRIQLGAFGVSGNAQALWGKLKGNAALGGRQAFFVPAGRLTKLQAGPFASRAEAQTACGQVGVAGCMPVG
ncbi:sporulation protein [Novosphingobium sp. Gsoil 351]|nr:sporulation protein [Novosphingobium sp. Gsoil 351]